MTADKTTIADLSIFMHDEEQSVFHHIDFARTLGGKEWLKIYVSNPLSTIKEINERQQTIQCILDVINAWPITITNGTIMVLEKFYETAIESIPQRPGFISAYSYKMFNAADYSLVKYSVGHFAEFVKGLNTVSEMLSQKKCPSFLQTILERIRQLLSRPQLQILLTKESNKDLPVTETLSEGYFLRNEFKHNCLELIELYSKLDAFYSMAVACYNYHLSFPTFVETLVPELAATQLYHPLLASPVSYDIELTHEQNFLFLTGANMAGKSTFIKAVGVAVYLAHIGMGVPAQTMELSLFDGLLSNIQVVDNIVKGESYFFNEVQRIRKTIEKISNGKKWLILIDELFKGTNVQDAMKCSSVVIEGLHKMKNTLFILSTHLYEIGEALRKYSNIQFRYFETEVQGDQLIFNYHLHEGISNDRLGYLILKKEGVVDMLEKLE
jgi:DNA mismatch repair protein MutS